jgi:hypothetical protein
MNNWSKRIEEVIIKIATKAAAYKYLHDESCNLYYRLNLIFSILIIFLITATGTITLIILDDNITIRYLNGIILFLTSVLTSIKEFINFTKLSQQHKLYSIRFSNLYHHIQRQLLTDVENRQNGRDYLGWINNEFDSLLLTNPVLPSYINKKMRLRFGDVLDINLFELTLCDNQHMVITVSEDDDTSKTSSDTDKKITMTHQQMYELQRFAS